MTEPDLIDPDPVYVATIGIESGKVIRYMMTDIDCVTALFTIERPEGRAHYLSKFHAVDDWRGPTYLIRGLGNYGGPLDTEGMQVVLDYIRDGWLEHLQEDPLLLARVASHAADRWAQRAEFALQKLRGTGPNPKTENIRKIAILTRREAARYRQGLESLEGSA